MRTRGDMYTPHPAGYRTQDPLDVRRLDLDLNPGPSCCETTVLTTKLTTVLHNNSPVVGSIVNCDNRVIPSK